MAKGPGRRRGWQRIETYHHKMSGINAPIYLDKEYSKFDGWIGDERYTGDTLIEVRDQIKKELDAREGFELRHILDIKMPSYYRYSRNYEAKAGYFGFEMEDYWVSTERVGSDNRYLISNGNYYIKDEDELMERRRKDAKPWRSWHDHLQGEELEMPCYLNGHVFLPYSEETVAALEHLQSQIDTVRERFIEFIETEAGLEKMVQIGTELLAALPAPQDEDYE